MKNITLYYHYIKVGINIIQYITRTRDVLHLKLLKYALII